MLKKVRFIIAFMSLSVCLCFMSSTYSRYIASTTGNVDALFAKWQILVNENDITNNSSSSIDIVPIIEENEYVADGVIAPSSEGYFDVVINPSNVDVSFQYSITLDVDNETMLDLNTTGYSIYDSTYVEGNPLEVIPIENNLINNILMFDNETPDFAFGVFTVRVYFEWYEGENETMNDEADTEVGNTAAAENTAFSVSASISFEQIISEE